MTPLLFVHPDAMATAAAFLAREWGDVGYRIAVQVGNTLAAVFQVAHNDGSRFLIAADRYGNVQYRDGETDEEALDLWADFTEAMRG